MMGNLSNKKKKKKKEMGNGTLTVTQLLLSSVPGTNASQSGAHSSAVLNKKRVIFRHSKVLGNALDTRLPSRCCAGRLRGSARHSLNVSRAVRGCGHTVSRTMRAGMCVDVPTAH